MKLQGNIQRGRGIYISSLNMDYFTAKLAGIDAQQGILITPYLITEDGSLYELHYYEFDVEVRDENSHFNDYNPRNSLPKEITENIKPQVIVAVADTEFYQESVSWYIEMMHKMTFTEVKARYPEFQNAELFYQIYMDTDEVYVWSGILGSAE